MAKPCSLAPLPIKLSFTYISSRCRLWACLCSPSTASSQVWKTFFSSFIARMGKERRVRIALLAMCNETYKRILIIWNYKFNVLIQLVMLAAIFLGATFFLGGGQFTPGLVASVFIGYVVWFYARIVIMGAGADMIGEAQSGTLEQMYMTPAPTEVLVLGRMLATLFTTTVMVIPMALA